ncbi:hypothetical protein TRIUR3_05406 [Triticum urartu]|uniref:Uncharacterized protein n=1 Tax=Triticum urartu TaxID=4572 RepID=M8AKU9_TRIUA|nr:hypothetical protein TRIUR3_05406 [Triticum urartu]
MSSKDIPQQAYEKINNAQNLITTLSLIPRSYYNKKHMKVSNAQYAKQLIDDEVDTVLEQETKKQDMRAKREINVSTIHTFRFLSIHRIMMTDKGKGVLEDGRTETSVVERKQKYLREQKTGACKSKR